VGAQDQVEEARGGWRQCGRQLHRPLQEAGEGVRESARPCECTLFVFEFLFSKKLIFFNELVEDLILGEIKKKNFFSFFRNWGFQKKIQPYGHFGMGIISRIVTYKKHKKRKMLSPHRNHDNHYYFSKLCLQHTK